MIGLVNLNKPVGMSSRGAVDIVGRAAKTRRAGHAGTLDPLASGVLIVCVGAATRLVPFIQDQPKRYRAEVLLGRRSDTDDITGEVVEIAVARRPDRQEMTALLPRFLGKISQIPPAFSAVHVAGERAYARARRGEAVEIAAREVEVHSLELAAYDYPRLELVVECGSGTYIRSLGRDIGEALGTGAVMSALVREAIGPFHIEDAVCPAQLTPERLTAALLPPLAAVIHLPRRICSSDEVRALIQGRAIAFAAAESVGETSVACVDPQGNLVAMAEQDKSTAVLRPRHVFVQADACPPVSGLGGTP